jgi:hypothetical protein
LWAGILIQVSLIEEYLFVIVAGLAFGTCKGIKHVLGGQRERATLRTDPGSCSGGVFDVLV